MAEKTKTKKPDVSIIIPAYKQEKRIKDNVEHILNVMNQTRWSFEIIVVVDGFDDKTYLEAKKVNSYKVKVCGYAKNMGKGYAIKYGMARTKGNKIAFIDSGMDINPNSISMVLEHMEWYGADIIVASKRHAVSIVKYPFIRKIYSRGYYTLVRLLFGLKISDTQTGLKVFKREVLEKVLPRLLVKRFAFDIEILSVAKRLGFSRIFEAPVDLEWDKANTSFDAFLFLDKEIRKILYDTMAVFYRLKILRYYDDKSKRKWIYDKDLDMRINTGEFTRE